MSKESKPAQIIDLSQSLSDKETEIELLQETFTTIGSEFDLDRIFTIVSERALELLDAETILIPLLDDNCETYTYRGGAGKNSYEIIGETLPLDFGVCGWVWKHKKAWWQGVLSELDEDEKNRWEKEAGNLLLVPLQGKRHFLGGIAGLNKKNGQAFSKRDLTLLQLFASIVSVAIENAIAVKATEDSLKQMEQYRRRLEVANRQLVESSKELEYLTLYDSITGLANRSLFYDRLKRDIKIASQDDRPVTILLIDITSFKNINDALGHDLGDTLLNAIARRFEELIDGHKTLARLGSDEFVVILPDLEEEQALESAGEYIKSLETGFNISDHHLVVDARVGVAVYPQHGVSVSDLMSHVDYALHEAKSKNQNICVYQHETNHLAKGHLNLVAEVRAALENQDFELYYQPKVDAHTGEIISAEVLGRWKSQSRGQVPPTVFIKILEEINLINEYTYWVIENVLENAGQWQSLYPEMRVAINVSPQTLMHPDFHTRIHRVIKDTDAGDRLILEITENLFLSEFDRLSDVLKSICKLGVRLSIDDYGTGYSSLSRLRRLPVSELKIDQSFVRDMVENRDDRSVVHSTIELAHNLGLSVVAEGVENQETLDVLRELNCDMIQGYHVSMPLPFSDFLEYIKR